MDGGQPQPLLDGYRTHAEARGDVLDAVAGLVQLGEGFHLVGRVHVGAHDVLGEADLADFFVLVHNHARHRVGVAVDLALRCQAHQRLQAATAGHDLVGVGG